MADIFVVAEIERKADERRTKKRKNEEIRETVLPDQLKAWMAWWEARRSEDDPDESEPPPLQVDALSRNEIERCFLARFGELPSKTRDLNILRKRLLRVDDRERQSKPKTHFERVVADIVAAIDTVPTDAAFVLTDGTSIGVHSLIMRARCPNAPADGAVQCAESAPIVRRGARALYTGKFDATTYDEAIEGLTFFMRVGCSDLVESCVQQVRQHVTEATLPKLMVFIGDQEDTPLMRSLVKRAKNLFFKSDETLRESEEWRACDKEKVEAVANKFQLEKKSKKSGGR